MRSIGLLSNRAKKNVGSDLAPERYEYLSLENAEPDFGFPAADDSLIGSNADGSRRFFTTDTGLSIDPSGVITGDETTFVINPLAYKYTNATTLRGVLTDINANSTHTNVGSTFVFRDALGSFSGQTVTAETLVTNGDLRGPAVFDIDPAPYIGNTDGDDPLDGLVQIHGSLDVLGDFVTVNTLNINVSSITLVNDLTANQIISTVDNGIDPPLVVASDIKVINLNADLLDGLDESDFLRSNASDNYTNGAFTFDNGTTLTAAEGATVNFNNAIGVAPFIVVSTTKVDNLNADLFDDLTSTDFTLDRVTGYGNTTTNSITVASVTAEDLIGTNVVASTITQYDTIVGTGTATSQISAYELITGTGTGNSQISGYELITGTGNLPSTISSFETISGTNTATSLIENYHFITGTSATGSAITGYQLVTGTGNAASEISAFETITGTGTITSSISGYHDITANNDLFAQNVVTPQITATTTLGVGAGDDITVSTTANLTFNATAGGIYTNSPIVDVSATGSTFTADVINANNTTVANLTADNIETLGYLRGPASFTIDPAVHGDDTGTVVIAGSIQVNSNTSISGNLILDGDLTVSGTTTTVSATNLTLSDNMIMLNEPEERSIANAVGDGVNVVYTTTEDHNYFVGELVEVTGVTPPSFNIASTSITAVTSNTFTIASTVTDTYSSGGTSKAKISANPDLGITGEYDAGSGVVHAGIFRDATDERFKLFHEYTPEPDASVFIDTGDPSFALANLQIDTLYSDDVELTGQIRGPATFVIDPATHGDNSGTVEVAGDLTVNSNLSVLGSGPPLIVTSSDLVTNLNADLLDSLDSTDFLRSNVSNNYTNGTFTYDSGTTLTVADGATVNFNNAIGTAPFTVVSTTKVTNLNADLLDDLDQSNFLRSNVNDNYTNGTLTFDSGTTLTAADGTTVNFNNAIGTAPFTVVSTDLVTNLNADLFDGLQSTEFNLDRVTDNGNTTTNAITVGNITVDSSSVGFGDSAIDIVSAADGFSTIFFSDNNSQIGRLAYNHTDNNIQISAGGASFANSLIVANGLVTVPSLNIIDTTTSTSSTTGALTVAGGVGIAENLNVRNNITSRDSFIFRSDLDVDVVEQLAEEYTATTTGAEIIASFDAANFTAAKLVIRAKDATGEVQASEVLLVHDGVTAQITEYAIVHTTANPIATYIANINAGTVRILSTAVAANTEYTVVETLIV